MCIPMLKCIASPIKIDVIRVSLDHQQCHRSRVFGASNEISLKIFCRNGVPRLWCGIRHSWLYISCFDRICDLWWIDRHCHSIYHASIASHCKNLSHLDMTQAYACCNCLWWNDMAREVVPELSSPMYSKLFEFLKWLNNNYLLNSYSSPPLTFCLIYIAILLLKGDVKLELTN